MAYEKLTEIISEDTSGSLAKIKVNNQWTFTVPDGIDYYADSEFDGWIEGGIDKTGVGSDGIWLIFPEAVGSTPAWDARIVL